MSADGEEAVVSLIGVAGVVVTPVEPALLVIGAVVRLVELPILINHREAGQAQAPLVIVDMWIILLALILDRMILHRNIAIMEAAQQVRALTLLQPVHHRILMV